MAAPYGGFAETRPNLDLSHQSAWGARMGEREEKSLRVRGMERVGGFR